MTGLELPSPEVLAGDQRITAWAKQLRAAGLDGDMDVLRARAYLDLLLGKDSRPAREARGAEAGATADGGTAGGSRPGSPGVRPAPRPEPGVLSAGFAGRVTLTIPLATVLDLAGRPGEIPGSGPVDPDPEANTSHRYQLVT